MNNLISLADLDYETNSSKDLEEFEEFSLKKLLKDYLFTDPSTRYQIAKNFFERKLFDAHASFFSFLMCV